MTAVLNLIDNVVSLYIWILFLAVIASWLINFNVINTSNRVVYMIVDTLYKLTEPALRPIRRLLPNMGGLDLSPVVLILLLYFFRDAGAKAFGEALAVNTFFRVFCLGHSRAFCRHTRAGCRLRPGGPSPETGSSGRNRK